MAPPTPTSDPSITDVAQVARALGADLERGLTAAEASRRLAEQGRNELRGAPRVPTWKRVLAHFQDPLIYLLLAAIAIALAAWFIEGRVGWPVDAVGADARLLQATTLRVQKASLTGESEAVLKDAATLPAAVPLGDRLNMALSIEALVAVFRFSRDDPSQLPYAATIGLTAAALLAAWGVIRLNLGAEALEPEALAAEEDSKVENAK